MPVQYSSVLQEHHAVRTAAGLFDVSHMGEASVRGPRACDLLQRLTCNDVGRLTPGRAQYNALTTPDGTFVDDLIVYMLGDNDYLVVLKTQILTTMDPEEFKSAMLGLATTADSMEKKLGVDKF